MVISFLLRLRRGERVLLGMIGQWMVFSLVFDSIDEMYEYEYGILMQDVLILLVSRSKLSYPSTFSLESTSSFCSPFFFFSSSSISFFFRKYSSLSAFLAADFTPLL